MTNADSRPRIHIWPERPPHNKRVRWSFGPTGMLHSANSAGEAVDVALDSIGHHPAVIIFEALIP